jgi:glutathione S-transferase
MITLYGHSFSRAHRNLWMLKELGVPFEHVPTGFIDGSTQKPDFLAINPNGRVPVLVDDGQPIFESMAINLYLARKFGGPLAPQSLIEEGLATQWSFWVTTEVEKPLMLAAANKLMFPEEQRNEEELQAMLKKLGRPLRVLDAHLADREHILGGGFTVADLNVSAPFSLALIAGISFDAYPRVTEWMHRCLERPAADDWKPISFTIPRPETALGMLTAFV